MPELQTIFPKEYLMSKGIAFRESGKELIAHCLFNGCDDDSRGTEAHLYFNSETGEYFCQKCNEKGNLITLARYLGDDIKSILLNGQRIAPIAKNYVNSSDVKKIWDTTTEPPADFPYLLKKKISPDL